MARLIFIAVRCCAVALLLAPVAGRAQTLALTSRDVLAFVGGEDFVESQRNSYLELLLTRGLVERLPHLRYLCWEGDTVFEQRRDLNFGAWTNQLQRAGVTAIVAQFGQAESLRGAAGLPEFVAAYEVLLDQFALQTKRIVLVSPTPFENPGGTLPDLSARNGDLQQYVAGMRELAARRGFPFVDVFTPLRGAGVRLTRDGLHLSGTGQWFAARGLSLALGGGAAGDWKLDERTGALSPAAAESLRGVIAAKNRLWFDYWRPMNWAFLNGDRTSQPSSRDHVNHELRWFPGEMEKFLPLIRAKEDEIGRLARGLK
ncbi:MAG: hypothetical protein HY301_07895 [Verrucomicrobia bacterium]|nr:hypothetical protein [Verrucomicrobiota bacterium]